MLSSSIRTRKWKNKIGPRGLLSERPGCHNNGKEFTEIDQDHHHPDEIVIIQRRGEVPEVKGQ